ncbi:MAG: endonuclease/exonuclease/phosphatase family protein [Clostridia bacterium]|nr:endonuclease/exonuclease/phosphatase family protein [Clostridia bacterium]
MKIVSFNIRCAWEQDINGFLHRAGIVYERIKTEQPDIIGFQEVTENILEMMVKLFPDYNFTGHGRCENYDGEGLYIATRKETCDVLSFDSFWLSDTPRVPGSRYEKQSECPRICNVAKIKYKKTGEIIRVFNLHLDHEYDEAKVAGMKCVLDTIEKYQREEPHEFVITGDFNAEPDEEAKRLCDAFEGIKEMTINIPYTFHDNGITKIKWDYIYLTNKLADRFISNGTWEDSYNGIYLSDHHAVYVILKD